jgi:hypothetical protein
MRASFSGSIWHRPRWTLSQEIDGHARPQQVERLAEELNALVKGRT